MARRVSGRARLVTKGCEPTAVLLRRAGLRNHIPVCVHPEEAVWPGWNVVWVGARYRNRFSSARESYAVERKLVALQPTIVQVAWPGTGDLLLQERAAVAGKVQGQAIRIPFNVQLRSAEPGAEHAARPRAQSLTLPLRDGVEGLALVLGPGVGAGPGAGPDALRRADTGAAAAADAAAAAAAQAAAARGERALAGANGSLPRMAVWIESQGAALLLRGPGGPGGPGSPGELEAELRRLR